MTEQLPQEQGIVFDFDRFWKELEAHAEKQRKCDHDWKLMSRSVRNGWKVSEWWQCPKCGANK